MGDIIVYSEGFASNSLLQLTVRYEKPENDWDSPFFIILSACPPGKEQPYILKKPHSVNMAFSTEHLDAAGTYIQALCTGTPAPWRKFADPRKRGNTGEGIKTFTAAHDNEKGRIKLTFTAKLSVHAAKGLNKQPDEDNMVSQVVTISFGTREAYALGRKLCVIAKYFQEKRLEYSFGQFKGKLAAQRNNAGRPEGQLPKAA